MVKYTFAIRKNIDVITRNLGRIYKDLPNIYLCEYIHRCEYDKYYIIPSLDFKYLIVIDSNQTRLNIYRGLYPHLIMGDIFKNINGEFCRIDGMPNDFMYAVLSRNEFKVKYTDGQVLWSYSHPRIKYPHGVVKYEEEDFMFQKFISPDTCTLFICVDNIILSFCYKDRKSYLCNTCLYQNYPHPTSDFHVHDYAFNELCFVITNDLNIMCLDYDCEIFAVSKIFDFTVKDEIIIFETRKNRVLLGFKKCQKRTYMLFEMRDNMIHKIWERIVISCIDTHIALYDNFLVFLPYLQICNPSFKFDFVGKNILTLSGDRYGLRLQGNKNGLSRSIYEEDEYPIKYQSEDEYSYNNYNVRIFDTDHNFSIVSLERFCLDEYNYLIECNCRSGSELIDCVYDEGEEKCNNCRSHPTFYNSVEVDDGIIIENNHSHIDKFIRNSTTEFYEFGNFNPRENNYFGYYQDVYNKPPQIYKISAHDISYSNRKLLHAQDHNKLTTKLYFTIWLFKRFGIYKDLRDYIIKTYI